MEDDKIQKSIEFILDQQAKLEANQQILQEGLLELKQTVSTLQETVEAGFTETREAIDKLLNIIEDNRDFTQQVARLAMASEKRLAILEGKVAHLEGE